jgi:hypothetical protein
LAVSYDNLEFGVRAFQAAEVNKKNFWVGAAAAAVLLVGCSPAGPLKVQSVGMTSSSPTSASSTLTAADQTAISDTIKNWTLEPRCDLMTDDFLSEQVLHSFDGDRAKQCDLYKSLFVPKQYGRDAIRVSDIQGNATEATAVCGDFVTNVTSKFTLVNNGSGWKIARTG